MITLFVALLLLAFIAIVFLLITGVIAVAWPVIVILILLAVDICMTKLIFGRKKKDKKE